MEAKAWAHEVRAFTRYRSADGTVGETNSTAGITFKNGLYVGGNLNTAGLPLSTDNITILGETGQGYVQFAGQSAAPVLALGHVYVDSGRKVTLGASGSTLFNIAFDNQLLTASRIYAAPNKSGTFAMTDDNVSQFTNDSGYITPVALANYVQGPAGSVTGSLPSFSNTTGKFLQDSGIGAATVVVGPGSAVSANIPSFSGTSGKLIQDSGVAVGSVVVGPASAVSGQIPMFSGTTGKLIADSGVGITGGGIISLGGFNFTVPATGTAVLTSRGLTAGAGLTGGGDLSADRSFVVGAGAGITVNADDVALTTPGTITIATGNSSAGSHTHAITSSSNPGVAASLLATDASGNVILQNLSLGGTQFLPVTTFHTDIGQMSKKFREIHGAELHVETLVAQESQATIGGRILVGPTTSLIADALAAATTIDVKHNQMANGDRIYLEDDGKVEFMAVTSGPTTITGGYRYSVTRNLDGSGANDWFAGDAVFNTGQTGDGFIDIYSEHGVKSASEIGPTIVGNVRHSSTYNDWVAHWAIGNLKGLYGYTVPTFGVALGMDGSPDFITVDPTDGLIIRGGGGNVSLDEDGLSLIAGTSFSAPSAVTWQSGGTVAAGVYGSATGTSIGNIQLEAVSASGVARLTGSSNAGYKDFELYAGNGNGSGVNILKGVTIGRALSPNHMLDIYGEGWFETGISLLDSSAAFNVAIRATSSTALTAHRTFTVDLVNAARTLKLTGNPTLADWFDQSVKVAATPQFAGLRIGAAGPLTAGWIVNHAGTDQNLVMRGPVTLGTGTTLQSVNDAESANLPLELRSTQVMITSGLNVGGVGPFFTGGVTAHTAANQNLILRGNVALGTGVTLQSLNDAESANLPLEIRATFVAVSVGGMMIGGTTDPGVNKFAIANSHTPASAAAAGVTGTVAWDGSFIYVCTATNTWKRAAIAAW